MGVNYFKSFSPVVGINSLRTILALSTGVNFEMITFDVKTAFLYGALEEEIYMYLLEGYDINGNKNQVFRLNKSLYGLKEAPLNWNEKFSNFLKIRG